MFEDFRKYLIMVSVRSLDYAYTDEPLFDNIAYFEDCFKRGLSAYKALLFLGDYLATHIFDDELNNKPK